MTMDEAYESLPDFIKDDNELKATLDSFIDRIAANSKYTNEQVAIAFFKLIHVICATNGGVRHGIGRWRLP